MSKITLPIYLDYAATTPADFLVAEKMANYLTVDGVFGNPASRSHRFGWQAEEAVDNAREQVAELINADPREIVFTSGATEATNLALKGVAAAYQHKGKHLITLCTEHKATLDTCAELEQQGYTITYLPVRTNGSLDLAELERARQADTVLLSVMQVNNETGVLQDIAAISQWCKQHDILLHVDGAQSVAKMAVDVRALNIDLLSISAHKMYGPKGVGALYVRRTPRVQLHAQMHGGGHERGMRSGTLATHQIVGMGEAARIAKEQLHDNESNRLLALKMQLWDGIRTLPGVRINGSLDNAVAGILNVQFAAIEGEALLMAIQDLAVSTGSACTSASVEPSYVLRALGVSDALAHSSVRFSVGRYTSVAEIEYTVALLNRVVPALHNAKSLWQL